ncbi:RING-H2 finger protein ATL40-like [Pistacia vera]|uniref:RING-H2 finger protein ATL40-like n=1 Tax=Pistacia vera TaxID=55513 RepID=UPI00126335B2|nr:RING-H2 finger protein ATL40-like [Pistacia vera]
MSYDDDHDHDPSSFTSKNPYDLNSKIMLTAIISLSFVVVLVIVLHIYARCVLRRQARQRRAAIRSLDLTAAHGQSGEPPKTGLDPLVISSLPMFVFKQKDGVDVETMVIECAVCLSNLENEEMARLLPNCKHTFHAGCIDKWFGSHSTCPICRTEAEPRLQPESREGPSSAVAATAPPLERVNSTLSCQEGTSNTGGESSAKILGSSSRLSSFRRILSRDRSSRRLQSCSQEDMVDLERQ